MTKKLLSGLLLGCLIFALCGCVLQQTGNPTEDFTVFMNMNTEYPVSNSLPEGNGETVKVIVLLGQSNATGCSITSYLKEGVEQEQYARYEQGFDDIKINFCLDDHSYTSNGAFVPVDLSCGAGTGYFGPEVGMAEVLSDAWPGEKVFILKYTMSGYSLHHNWLRAGKRGSIYDACMTFLLEHLSYMKQKNYDPRIGAICWMQGESDTTDFKASQYLANQSAFVSYLREDLAAYGKEEGIYFIDAGISNSPYCEPAYPAINEAKVAFSQMSALNLYFSTIEAGLTIHKEPEGNPDWGHYDALSELQLGRMFGRCILHAYAETKGA